MLSWNFYFRRNKKYIPTFPDTKKIQTMDCSILFCFRKTITKYRSHSNNSIDYCPSSILLGNRFHIFHPLTKVVQRQSSLREKVCSILLYLLTYFPTEKGMGKKNKESQKRIRDFFVACM